MKKVSIILSTVFIISLFMTANNKSSEILASGGFYLKGTTSQNNASVRLYDSSNNLIASTTSSSTGYYIINLGTTAGDYKVTASTSCVNDIFYSGSSNFYFNGSTNIWQDINMGELSCVD